MLISDVLRSKGPTVVTVRPDETVRALVEVLGAEGVGAAVVSADGESVAGIVSERDVVRGLRTDETLLERPVAEIMTAEVRTCRSGQSVDEIMRLMTEHRIRHVPVVEDGALAGIVSIGDVVKSRIDELVHERDQLTSYVGS